MWKVWVGGWAGGTKVRWYERITWRGRERGSADQNWVLELTEREGRKVEDLWENKRGGCRNGFGTGGPMVADAKVWRVGNRWTRIIGAAQAVIQGEGKGMEKQGAEGRQTEHDKRSSTEAGRREQTAEVNRTFGERRPDVTQRPQSKTRPGGLLAIFKLQKQRKCYLRSKKEHANLGKSRQVYGPSVQVGDVGVPPNAIQGRWVPSTARRR